MPGACLICTASLSVQPGGQGHLVVHYLEGFGQRGDPWQGESAPRAQPVGRSWSLVLVLVGSAFNGPKAASLSGPLLLRWLWVCPGEGWGAEL